jgi:beta-barrel assembly-enhancing protease
MKAAVVVLSTLFVVSTAARASAQIGGILRGANKAVDTKQKLDDMNFTDAEEKQLGEQVSQKLRARFGVYQNEAVTKYVTLVGTAVAQSSTRPNLDWKFIVLDTDGVNAYAAPGGFVHITRGLLGLMKNEAQLAGVLGHEVTHITVKHTIRSIQKNKGSQLTADTAGGTGGLKTAILAQVADLSFRNIFDGAFSREDEEESDEVGVRIASKLAYAPTGMAEVLKAIADRNAGRQDRNGWFSSHPAIKDRISRIEKQVKNEKLTSTATVAARYGQHIKFEVKPITEIAMDVEGAAGLASGDKKKEEKPGEKKEEKKGGIGSGLSKITGGNKQASSSQQAASAGARGGVPDRDAKGGSNPSIVGVKVSAAELETFKKGIAA